MNEIEPLQKNEVNPKLETSLVRGSGVDIFKLSYFDGIFVEQFMKHRTLGATAKAMSGVLGKPVKWQTLMIRLKRLPHLAEHLKRRMRASADANMTRDEFLAEMRRLAESDKKVNSTTPTFWKLFADAKGFLSNDNVVINNENKVINFTQADGSL